MIVTDDQHHHLPLDHAVDCMLSRKFDGWWRRRVQQAGGLGVRAAVLLHGPPGSGRRCAAAAVAAAFGAHLVSVNCHDLKASPSAMR
jgi:SpoVK/Ycf46/Vps4 family AAA+-type ATPase